MLTWNKTCSPHLIVHAAAKNLLRRLLKYNHYEDIIVFDIITRLSIYTFAMFYSLNKLDNNEISVSKFSKLFTYRHTKKFIINVKPAATARAVMMMRCLMLLQCWSALFTSQPTYYFANSSRGIFKGEVQVYLGPGWHTSVCWQTSLWVTKWTAWAEQFLTRKWVGDPGGFKNNIGFKGNNCDTISIRYVCIQKVNLVDINLFLRTLKALLCKAFLSHVMKNSCWRFSVF